MCKLEFNYESEVGVISKHVSDMVRCIYYAPSMTNLEFNRQECMTNGEVMTDHVYCDQDEIKVLWEDKSPTVFNKFIKQLQ
jgi:hypothetical protein